LSSGEFYKTFIWWIIYKNSLSMYIVLSIDWKSSYKAQRHGATPWHNVMAHMPQN